MPVQVMFDEWMNECTKAWRTKQKHTRSIRKLGNSPFLALEASSGCCLSRYWHVRFQSTLSVLLFLSRQEWERWGISEEEGGGRRPSREPCCPCAISGEPGAARRQQLEEDCTSHLGHHHTQHPRWGSPQAIQSPFCRWRKRGLGQPWRGSFLKGLGEGVHIFLEFGFWVTSSRSVNVC